MTFFGGGTGKEESRSGVHLLLSSVSPCTQVVNGSSLSGCVRNSAFRLSCRWLSHSEDNFDTFIHHRSCVIELIIITVLNLLSEQHFFVSPLPATLSSAALLPVAIFLGYQNTNELLSYVTISLWWLIWNGRLASVQRTDDERSTVVFEMYEVAVSQSII
jgi:hypothetical protein